MRLSRAGRWALVAAVAAIVAAVAVSASLLAGRGGAGASAPATRLILLTPVGARFRQASGTARIRADGRMLLSVSGLPASGGDRFYEAWAGASALDAVSVGSFSVGRSGHATVVLPMPFGPAGPTFVDISLEPRDGDPASSGDSVLRSPA